MKKVFSIIILFLTMLCSCGQSFANVNETEYIKRGDSFLYQAQRGHYPEFTPMYLKKAQYFYYVASKNTPPSVDALIGLGRVYILQNKKEDAKNVLFQAYSMDTYNANANFYLAEFFYSDDDFVTALKYYEKAKELQYNDSAKNIEMIKKCQAKLGANSESE